MSECCETCGEFAGKHVERVERPALSGPPSSFTGDVIFRPSTYVPHVLFMSAMITPRGSNTIRAVRLLTLPFGKTMSLPCTRPIVISVFSGVYSRGSPPRSAIRILNCDGDAPSIALRSTASASLPANISHDAQQDASFPMPTSFLNQGVQSMYICWTERYNPDQASES